MTIHLFINLKLKIMKSLIFLLLVTFVTIFISCKSTDEVQPPITEKESIDETFQDILAGTIYYDKDNNSTCYYIVKKQGNKMAVILSPSFNISTNSNNLIQRNFVSCFMCSVMAQLFMLGVVKPFSLDYYIDKEGNVHTKPFSVLDENNIIKKTASFVFDRIKESHKYWEITKGFGWSEFKQSNSRCYYLNM